MAVHISVVSLITLVSVSGQFLEPQYGLDVAPLQFRPRPSSAKFEIQPSVSREIEYPHSETSRSSNQGRRHIENHQRDNIQNVQNNKNINDYGAKPYENVYTNNNEDAAKLPGDAQFNHDSGQVNSDSQFAQIQQQNRQNYMRENNQNINRNTENRHQKNKNKGVITPITAYDINNLRTNENPRLNKNSQAPIQDNSNNQQVYPYENVRTNVHSKNQPHGTRFYDDSSPTESPTRTNIVANANASPSQITPYKPPNYPSNGNIRKNDNPSYQQNDKVYIETSTLPIDKINHNEQNVDSIINNNNDNRHDAAKPGNKNDENNRQTTEPGKRITAAERKVTGGTKSTQDNELASKSNEGRTMDEDKWIWNDGSDTSSTKTTIIPTVDDRAAFDGGKCPTGQIRFNNQCVDTD